MKKTSDETTIKRTYVQNYAAEKKLEKPRTQTNPPIHKLAPDIIDFTHPSPSQKRKKILVITLALVGVILTASTMAVLVIPQNSLNSPITAIGLGVYSDSACTQNCTSLNFGNITPGGTVTITIYVKNTGNSNETLTMTINDWNPESASSYLTLTWNKENTIITPGETIEATLTLTATPDTGSLTSFGCFIVFNGATS